MTDSLKKICFHKLLFGAVVAVVLGGCATVGTEPVKSAPVETPEQATMRRAQERWDALLAMDFPKAYAFISPAGKSKFSVEDFSKRINGQYWRGTTVKSATCEPEICTVSLDFHYDLAGNKLHQVIREKWILDNGAWWFVFQP
ncbi:MAG: hypothetical protein JNJ55_02550 [Betaproteobacteria bacterium]|nr:hypothetical protein [Betaproteobacteria bacterium]